MSVRHLLCRRRHDRGSRPAAGAFALLLSVALAASPPVLAQPVPCEEWLATSALGPRGNAVIQVCSPALRAVPGIAAQVDAINERLTRSEASLQELTRFVRSFNATAKSLVPHARENQLIESFAARLAQISAQSDAQVLRSIERLRHDFDEFAERIGTASGNRDAEARVQIALKGDAGAAAAQLDFVSANRLLDVALRIEGKVDALGERIGSLDRRVDDMASERRLADAWQLLTQVARSKPRGEQGQSDAVRTLIAARRTFGGFDFTGMHLVGVNAAGIEAANADFTLAELADARLDGARLHGARLRAASASRSSLRGADLTEVRAEFSQFAGARLATLVAPRSTWTGSSLQGADFSNANLEGANFEFADLRGANFTGARLKNAFFGGADLRDVKWSGAHLENTDIIAAAIERERLSADQLRGICTTPMARRAGYFPFARWRIFETAPPDPRSGREVFDLDGLPEGVVVPAVLARAAPRCVARDDRVLPPGRQSPLRKDVAGEAWNDEIRLSFPRILLDSGGRRDDLRRVVVESFSKLSARFAFAESSAHIQAIVQALATRFERESQERLRSIRPPRSLRFTGDTALLLAQRLDAGVLARASLNWTRLPAGGLRAREATGPSETEPGEFRWPALLPASVEFEELGLHWPMMLKRWYEARAALMSSNLVWVDARATALSEPGLVSWPQAFRQEPGPNESLVARALSARESRVVVLMDKGLSATKGQLFVALIFDADVAETQRRMARDRTGPAPPEIVTLELTQVRLLPAPQPDAPEFLVFRARAIP